MKEELATLLDRKLLFLLIKRICTMYLIRNQLIRPNPQMPNVVDYCDYVILNIKGLLVED